MNLAISSEGYIPVEQSVEAWSSNEDRCIMIALSPVLLDHEVRLVLTYQPSAPLLSSCLKFNSPSKDCDVHAAHPQCALPSSSASSSSRTHRGS